MSKMLNKLILSTVISLFVAVQLSPSVLAATDEEAAAAAQTGVTYLADNQQADGSISGFGGETEWSVVAVEASGQDASSFNNGGTSAVDYLSANPPAPTAPATDVERKVIAIAAADEDVTNFGGVNYSDLLASYHNNNQIGDTTLLNDDIFGVIAIDASGQAALKTEAQDGLDYFLAYQAADGGFSYTTTTCAWCGSDSNDTAAAIIAMYSAEHLGLINDNLVTSKNSATVYLLSTQQADGGFGYDAFSPPDGSSTSWALMALNTIGESVRSQALLARDWLLLNQNPDGGFSFGAYGFTSSDTYTTAHAITALLGSSWLLRPAPFTTVTPSPVTQVQTTSPQAVLASATLESPTTTTTPTELFSGPLTQGIASSNIQSSPFTNNATDNKESPKINSSNKPKTNFSIYAVLLLVVAAIAWYVVESRKTSGVANS